MSHSIFLELTEIKGQPSNLMFERTIDHRVLQISADGSYINPVLDSIILVDLQAKIQFQNGQWNVIDDLANRAQPVEEGQIFSIKGCHFRIHLQYQSIGQGVSEEDFQKSIAIAISELSPSEQTDFYGFSDKGNLSLGVSSEPLALEEEPEDILRSLEQEYFAIIKTPELLYRSELSGIIPEVRRTGAKEDLLSKGEHLKAVPVLDMVEGAMSIRDVEKLFSDIETDFFQFESSVEDVLSLFDTEESSVKSTWVAPAVSQKNHRHHSMNSQLSVQFKTILSEENET